MHKGETMDSNQITINDELKSAIREIVKESIEDYLEELEAAASKDYIKSIRESREVYKSGKTVSL